MEVVKTKLPGVVVFEPKVFHDQRGFFLETFRLNAYQEAGADLTFVQDNHSRSSKGVIRGLHYQLKHPQGKLVSVSRGAVLDVVLDIRLGSPTFGQWISVELSDENHRRIYVPPGYAHGVCVLSETVDLHYKCTDYYHPEDEYGIIFNDSDLEIDWQVETPILSEKDQKYPKLREQALDKLPQYDVQNTEVV